MSDRDGWRTPASFMALVVEVLHHIDLDPLSSDWANETVQAARYFTPELPLGGGFNAPWKCSTMYMNPGYSSAICKRAIGRFLDAWWKGEIDTSAIVLLNNITDTSYGSQILTQCSTVCFPRKRMQFDPPPGVKPSSNRYGQMVLYFGDDVGQFDKVFNFVGKLGPVFENYTLLEDEIDAN